MKPRSCRAYTWEYFFFFFFEGALPQRYITKKFDYIHSMINGWVVYSYGYIVWFCNLCVS